MRSIKNPILRYHGAKFRLAPWILSFFPAHTCYVEPFGGAAGILLQKPRSYAEVYNDLDGDIVNLFRVLQQPEARAALIEAIRFTPYARAEFEKAYQVTNDSIESARRLCIRAQMGYGSAGASKGITGFRIDTGRQPSHSMKHWQKFPDIIADLGERFSGVLIENRPAIQVMQQHDTRDTLHYLDPPYVHSTRCMGAHKSRYYRHEMTNEEHLEMIQVAARLDGMVLISGYDSALYNDALKDWHREEKNSRISAGRGTAVRKEILWINQAAKNRLRGQLF